MDLAAGGALLPQHNSDATQVADHDGQAEPSAFPLMSPSAPMLERSSTVAKAHGGITNGSEEAPVDDEQKYHRFTRGQKRRIIAIVAYAGFQSRKSPRRSTPHTSTVLR
jgi:hypothetical protein